MIPNRSMPQSTSIPKLAYPDIREAADWLCAAFGFTVRLRIGDHRARLNVTDGAVVLMEGRVDGLASSVMARVDDVDAHCGRAR